MSLLNKRLAMRTATKIAPDAGTADKVCFEVNVEGTDIWRDQKHGIPKQVIMANQRYYYIDIREGKLFQASTLHPELNKEWPLGDKDNFVTSVTANTDGTLFVVTQNGLLRVAPPRNPNGEPEIYKVCDIPGLSEDVRVNNANMVDGKLFIGTALKDPNGYAQKHGFKNVGEMPKDQRPAKLFVFDGKELAMKEVASGFGVVNAIASAGTGSGNLTYGDSAPGVEHLYMAHYDDAKGMTVTKEKSFLDRAGRPDGANPVQVKLPGASDFQNCIAVAAIDSNEVRILNTELQQVGTIKLPPEIVKPTMASFRNVGNGVEMFVTTLEPEAGKTSGDAGKIFSVTLDSNMFHAVNPVGKYDTMYNMGQKLKGNGDGLAQDTLKHDGKTPEAVAGKIKVFTDLCASTIPTITSRYLIPFNEGNGNKLEKALINYMKKVAVHVLTNDGDRSKPERMSARTDARATLEAEMVKSIGGGSEKRKEEQVGLAMSGIDRAVETATQQVLGMGERNVA